jgi:hypothetical protein
VYLAQGVPDKDGDHECSGEFMALRSQVSLPVSLTCSLLPPNFERITASLPLRGYVRFRWWYRAPTDMLDKQEVNGSIPLTPHE